MVSQHSSHSGHNASTITGKWQYKDHMKKSLLAFLMCSRRVDGVFAMWITLVIVERTNGKPGSSPSEYPLVLESSRAMTPISPCKRPITSDQRSAYYFCSSGGRHISPRNNSMCMQRSLRVIGVLIRKARMLNLRSKAGFSRGGRLCRSHSGQFH